ncbi:glutathionylspermidine synthase family protein [Niveispirillum sp. KHB5.9]|uniref:glutathionylspermidine synthase family protein n=1 Tax=Niveispirillum sp. KHB5.9 TaxID=3400269 RepID=UPI003A889348
MNRQSLRPRPDWRARMEALGFDFHTIPTQEDPSGLYWDESACWVFSEQEIDLLDDAATELHRLCLAAAGRIVDERLYPLLNIPDFAVPAIEASWQRHKAGKEFSLYGRFDLAYGGPGHGDGSPKLLEYNADTPTGLYEASVAQWAWLEEVFPEGDQFNSIHEGLVEQWRALAGGGGTLHLTCAMPHAEDEGTLRYLQDTAIEAGLATKSIALSDIGWTVEEDDRDRRGFFTDLEEQEIHSLFKLTPWEWMVADEFGGKLLDLSRRDALRVVEPAWKMLLSNKGLLAVLWEMYPGHPNLVEAHFDRSRFAPGTRVAAKPLLGREGAGISIATLGEGGRAERVEMQVAGPYGAEGYVYQAWSPVASARAPDAAGRMADHHAVIGAWMVGNTCRGIGIREDSTAVTRDTSRFVPHRFE